MSSTGFLLRPMFWVLFAVIVVIAMFVYGMKLVRDDTLLAQAARNLSTTKQELQEFKGANSSLRTELSNRTLELASSHAQLANTQGLLAATDERLTEQTQQLDVKEQELRDCAGQILARDKKLADIARQLLARENTISELNDTIKSLRDSHPYGKGRDGKGQGKLTIYNDCNCPTLRVWVDNKFVGEASPNSTNTCGAPGTANIILSIGKHHVIAADARNQRWEFDVNIQEDTCLLNGLSNR
jgi:septal ring factor EnvC (AmiA/AmiB activator)